MRDWQIPAVIDSVELVVSELMTNAVKSAGANDDPDRWPVGGRREHDPSLTALRITAAGTHLLIEVYDENEAPPVLQNRDGHAEGGRGLVLVAAFAHRWSFYYPKTGGKVVWAELNLPAPESANPGEALPQLPRREDAVYRHTWPAEALPVAFTNDPAILQRVADPSSCPRRLGVGGCGALRMSWPDDPSRRQVAIELSDRIADLWHEWRKVMERPKVFGYISLEDDDEAEISRSHDQLAAHAEAEDLAVVEIFVDRNMPPGRLIRPGLTILLECLRQHEGAGLLVPSLNHLSSWSPVRRAIEMEVQLLGARLIAIDPAASTPATGVPRLGARSASI